MVWTAHRGVYAKDVQSWKIDLHFQIGQAKKRGLGLHGLRPCSSLAFEHPGLVCIGKKAGRLSLSSSRIPPHIDTSAPSSFGTPERIMGQELAGLILPS